MHHDSPWRRFDGDCTAFVAPWQLRQLHSAPGVAATTYGWHRRVVARRPGRLSERRGLMLGDGDGAGAGGKVGVGAVDHPRVAVQDVAQRADGRPAGGAAQPRRGRRRVVDLRRCGAPAAQQALELLPWGRWRWGGGRWSQRPGRARWRRLLLPLPSLSLMSVVGVVMLVVAGWGGSLNEGGESHQHWSSEEAVSEVQRPPSSPPLTFFPLSLSLLITTLFLICLSSALSPSILVPGIKKRDERARSEVEVLIWSWFLRWVTCTT